MGDQMVLSAIVGASASFVMMMIFNIFREQLRRKREMSRRDEVWE
jgi:hypothetical protein